MTDLTQREYEDRPYDEDMAEPDPDDQRDAAIFDEMVAQSERDAEFWLTHSRIDATPDESDLHEVPC
jgi:hypothetical protein